MKEKKIKRKQNRKILPVVLVIVMLVSMLAVSASAAEAECGCYGEDNVDVSFTLRRSEVKDYWILECYSCHVLRYFYEAGSFERLTDYEVSDGPYYDSVNGNFLAGMCGGDEGMCVDFQPACVDGLPTNAPSDNKGMVGKMVAAITTSVTAILGGVGSAVVGFFDSTVLAENGQLSTFAVWLLAFLGIAFALGVVKFITNLVRKR